MKWVKCVLTICIGLGFSVYSYANPYIFSPSKAEYYKKQTYTFYDSVLRDIKLFKYEQPIAIYIPIDIPDDMNIKKANLKAKYDSRNFASKNIYVAFKNSFGIEDDGRDIYSIQKTDSSLWSLQEATSSDVTPSNNLASQLNQVLSRTNNKQGQLLLLLCPTQSCEQQYRSEEIEIEDLQLVVELESSADGSQGDSSDDSSSDGSGGDSTGDSSTGGSDGNDTDDSSTGGSADSGQDDSSTGVQVSDILLKHSLNANRASATALEGKTLYADEPHYIFVSEVSGMDSVSFYINGRLLQTEYQAPFDMAGTAGDSSANPLSLQQLYDSNDLVDGKNYIHVVVNNDSSLNKEVEFYYEHIEQVIPLSILSQPESSYSVFEGDQLALKLSVQNGTGQYSYTWYKNGSVVQQQNSTSVQNTLQLNQISLSSNSSWFQCAVNDGVSYLECNPTQLQVQQVSISGQAYLTWEAPQYRVNGEFFYVDEIDHYQVRYWREGSESYKDIKIYDALKTDLLIENLSQGRWYFRIRVIDKDGLSSEFSSSVNKSI
ncbi:MAG: fibronectin type III domain-containing protein [Bdellovibrionales bacterium]|nr:fibronectin type III domain-containing protein [Bdellovibrionales bacterium]